MESLQLYLNSSNADNYIGNNKSYCEWILPVIEIPDGFHIYLSVQNTSIPYSFYNINSTNNTLIYLLSPSVYNTIIIPQGNYNINNLISTLISLMTGFTITYNNITNKITIIYSLGDFTLLLNSSILSILGFSTTSIIRSLNGTRTSDNSINMHPITSINVVSNLITYNINKSFLNNNSILCRIPINTPPFSIIEYNNNNNFRINLFINTFNSIKIKLLDDNGNILDLNGLNFSITLQLDVESFT